MTPIQLIAENYQKIAIKDIKLGMFVVAITKQKGDIDFKSGVVSSESTRRSLQSMGVLEVRIDLSRSKHQQEVLIDNPESNLASEEQVHADRLAERIVQLGGEPDFDPASIIKRSHSQYVAGSSLREMITEDLVAERVAVEIYSKLIRYIGDKDATTRRLLEEILEQEEEHADELSDFGARLKMSGDNK